MKCEMCGNAYDPVSVGQFLCRPCRQRVADGEFIGSEIPALRDHIAELEVQARLFGDGQERLKDQTVRIRRALTDERREGVDTEQIAKEVRARAEKAEAEVHRMRELVFNRTSEAKRSGYDEGKQEAEKVVASLRVALFMGQMAIKAWRAGHDCRHISPVDPRKALLSYSLDQRMYQFEHVLDTVEGMGFIAPYFES